MTWQFTLTGLLIGVLVGLTGMGGGALLTPILVILFGFKPTYAVGTDILHGAVFKTFGAVRHRRLGTVHARLTFWMFLGSGPMSLLGVYAAGRLEGNVDLHAMAWLLLGSVPGIWIASRFTLRLPDDALRLGLAGVLALSGVKLLNVPEANWVIAAGFVLGAAAFVPWAIRTQFPRSRPLPARSYD
jgi:uncharacterized protein